MNLTPTFALVPVSRKCREDSDLTTGGEEEIADARNDLLVLEQTPRHPRRKEEQIDDRTKRPDHDVGHFSSRRAPALRRFFDAPNVIGRRRRGDGPRTGRREEQAEDRGESRSLSCHADVALYPKKRIAKEARRGALGPAPRGSSV